MITVDELKQYTQENLIYDCLKRIPDNIDKREGSIIYDAVAPAMAELAGYYYNLVEVMNSTFIETAVGESLDKRVAEQGLFRKPPTSAVLKVQCFTADNTPFDVPLSTVFMSLNTTDQLTYVITERLGVGLYKIVCEQSGSSGNLVAELTTEVTIEDLEQINIDSIIEFGSDEEDDTSLRLRYTQAVMTKSFGGNIGDYVKWFESQPNIGGVRVFPESTSIVFQPISNLYEAITTEKALELKNLLDPENGTALAGSGTGIAPIGHVVDVVVPNYVDVAVNVEVTPTNVSNDDINKAINDYFLSVRSDWSTYNPSVSGGGFRYNQKIIHSQVVAAILSIDGVADATVTLNGSAQNIIYDASVVEDSVIPRAVITIV